MTHSAESDAPCPHPAWIHIGIERYCSRCGVERGEVIEYADTCGHNSAEECVADALCVHCGDPRSLHSEDREACVRAGYYGNRYTRVTSPGTDQERALDELIQLTEEDGLYRVIPPQVSQP